jgi:PPK2 family polyphosphate:nucleotide phosphotransferase
MIYERKPDRRLRRGRNLVSDSMFEAPPSPYLVPYDGSFALSDARSGPPANTSKKASEKKLSEATQRLDELQPALFAEATRAVLIIVQGLDASGKDGTVRALLEGIDPAGARVVSFKEPSQLELSHDFLWRTTLALPERGHIVVFNRSYYEEVLVVRVHPHLLDAQHVPHAAREDALWEERLESIRAHELHLARSGTVILKFWLNVSREVQRKRFLARLDTPEKNWKFAVGDVREREHWRAYMRAYQAALAGTSRPWAPWYAVPADDKHYLRATVAGTVVAALERLDLKYPATPREERGKFREMRRLLEADA